MSWISDSADSLKQKNQPKDVKSARVNGPCSVASALHTTLPKFIASASYLTKAALRHHTDSILGYSPILEHEC